MEDDSAAGSGQDRVDKEVELDDRGEEAREDPTIRVTELPRGPSAEEWASHFPSHAPHRT